MSAGPRGPHSIRLMGLCIRLMTPMGGWGLGGSKPGSGQTRVLSSPDYPRGWGPGVEGRGPGRETPALLQGTSENSRVAQQQDLARQLYFPNVLKVLPLPRSPYLRYHRSGTNKNQKGTMKLKHAGPPARRCARRGCVQRVLILVVPF